MQASYTKGQNLVATVDGIPVGCDKQTNIELQTSTFDVTSKCSVDTNGVLFAEMIPTIVSAKITGNGFVPILSSAGQPTEYSLQQLATLQLNQTKIYVTWEAPVVAGTTRLYLGCDCYVTSLKGGATVGEVVTYDYEFTSTGIVKQIPVS